MNVDVKEKIAIFDSDGVLLDTHSLVKSILPEFWQKFEEDLPWLWDIIRKLAILFGGDRICDDRLKGLSVETILGVASECEMFVITKRPFWFGGKKRLLKQLEAVYGKGVFAPENVFSSCFSRHKGEIVRYHILIGKIDFTGFIVDDNEKNLHKIPNKILPIWLNSEHKKAIHNSSKQYEIEKIEQLKIALDLLGCV